MSRITNDEEFFKENLAHINILVGKILAYANLAPVLLACGVLLKIFKMSIAWLGLFSCFMIPFAIIQNILARKCKNQKVVAYITLFGLQILVSFLEIFL